jgi:microcompartment protein CcmK/EutM
MNIVRVDGNIVTTACHPSLRGFRTVICQPLDAEGRDDGAPVLAIDTLGAGLHQKAVLSTDGSQTRVLVRDAKSPLRNHLAALVDGDTGTPARSGA